MAWALDSLKNIGSFYYSTDPFLFLFSYDEQKYTEKIRIIIWNFQIGNIALKGHTT